MKPAIIIAGFIFGTRLQRNVQLLLRRTLVLYNIYEQGATVFRFAQAYKSATQRCLIVAIQPGSNTSFRKLHALKEKFSR